MGTHTASSHNQKKDNKYKNKKQPELTEKQTVWKSDSQGVKEEIFIQASIRGGDGQLGGDDSWRGCSWWVRLQLADPVGWQIVGWVVPHLHAYKLGGRTRERDRPHHPGFHSGEIKPHTSD